MLDARVDDALTCLPGDAETLARRLAVLIDDREKRRLLGANARRRLAQDFSFEKMFGRTLAIYEAVLASRPRCG